jgi:vitamin B12 transporter
MARSRFFLPIVVPSVFTLTCAHAADDPRLEQVIVTAMRAPTALGDVGDSVTIISGERVRESQKTVMSDLLATTPGVQMSRNGGYGTTTSIRIRGAEGHHTVLLIDGVKLEDPSAPSAGYNFGNLLVFDDIERIEIVRGSQSTLWGSQAIGGVVNVVTKQPTAPLSLAIEAEGGSYSTGRVSARVQDAGDTFAWRLGGHYFRTRGVSAFDEDLGGDERDGYRNYGFNARGSWQITDTVTAELRSNWWRGRVEQDGFPPPTFSFADTHEYSITREWVNYVGLNVDALDGRLQHRLGVTFTDIDRRNFDPDADIEKTFDGYGRNWRYEYQGTLAVLDTLHAVFGLEREDSKLRTIAPSSFDPNPEPLQESVALNAAYAQLQYKPVTSLTLTAGVRRDDHAEFGGHTSVHAAAAFAVSRSTTLRASYGEGFKAPTLFQLYSEYGNTDLQPEEGETWDVGLEQRFFDNRFVASVTYFERDTKRMIDFVSCFSAPTARCELQPYGYYENLAKTKADGIELSVTAQLSGQWSVHGNYTWLDAENADRNSVNFGNQLARRPKETAYGEIRYRWNIPLLTSIGAQYVGRSFDNVANTNVLRAYTLVDVRAEYEWSKTLQLFGRLENALDKDYATARNYGSVGRAAYVGFRQKF